MTRTRHAVAQSESSSPTRVAISDIATMDRERLIKLWRDLHGAVPPRSISKPLLRRILAFDVQLQATGGWPVGLEERIIRAGHASPRAASAAPPLAGGRLLREWNGVTHVVEVTGAGYRWQGRDWRSLSAIARAITGAHWSGPRFFGLADEGASAGNGKANKGAKRNRSRATPTPAAGQPGTVRWGRADA